MLKDLEIKYYFNHILFNLAYVKILKIISYFYGNLLTF